jgi:hypothetical protein
MGTRACQRGAANWSKAAHATAEDPHKTRSPTMARKSGPSATIWWINWRPARAFDGRQTSRREVGWRSPTMANRPLWTWSGPPTNCWGDARPDLRKRCWTRRSTAPGRLTR